MYIYIYTYYIYIYIYINIFLVMNGNDRSDWACHPASAAGA